MRVSKHFIQGFLAPFGFMTSLFQIPTPERKQDGSEPPKSGFERDAENLRQDWLNVGNYINDAIDASEHSAVAGLARDAENIRGYWTNLGNYMMDVANGKGRKSSSD